MKKLVYTFLFLFSFALPAFSQDTDDPGGKLREKMIQYIEVKLSLSRAESEKFQPIFLDYLKQLRNTKMQYRGDRLVLNQKIADLRLRYRDQFKPVLGEQRSNQVFRYEQEFVEKVREEVQERRENRGGGRANKRNGALLQ